MVCKQCGAENDSDAKFCQECEHLLEKEDVVSSGDLQSQGVFNSSAQVTKDVSDTAKDINLWGVVIAIACIALLCALGVYIATLYNNHISDKNKRGESTQTQQEESSGASEDSDEEVALDKCLGMLASEVTEKYGIKESTIGDSEISFGLEDDNAMLIVDDNNSVVLIAIDGEGKYTACNLRCGMEWWKVQNILFSAGDTLQRESESYDNATGSYDKVYYFQEASSGNYIECTIRADELVKVQLGSSEYVESAAGTNTTPTPVPTLAPTPVPTVAPDYSYDDYTDDYTDDDSMYDDSDYSDSSYQNDYILPDSAAVKLTKSDLEGMSKEELRLARNEIYARHGRLFQDEELQEYFDAQDWYEGYIEPEDFVDSEELSALERRNAKFIQKYE